MRTRRVGAWLWTSVIAGAMIGCGGSEEGAPPAKPGPPPAPPEGAKDLFKKPGKMPNSKSGALQPVQAGWDGTLLAGA